MGRGWAPTTRCPMVLCSRGQGSCSADPRPGVPRASANTFSSLRHKPPPLGVEYGGPGCKPRPGAVENGVVSQPGGAGPLSPEKSRRTQQEALLGGVFIHPLSQRTEPVSQQQRPAYLAVHMSWPIGLLP